MATTPTYSHRPPSPPLAVVALLVVWGVVVASLLFSQRVYGEWGFRDDREFIGFALDEKWKLRAAFVFVAAYNVLQTLFWFYIHPWVNVVAHDPRHQLHDTRSACKRSVVFSGWVVNVFIEYVLASEMENNPEFVLLSISVRVVLVVFFGQIQSCVVTGVFCCCRCCRLQNHALARVAVHTGEQDGVGDGEEQQQKQQQQGHAVEMAPLLLVNRSKAGVTRAVTLLSPDVSTFDVKGQF